MCIIHEGKIVEKESVCGRHASYSGQDCEEVLLRFPQDQWASTI